jgi:hypothetical protein
LIPLELPPTPRMVLSRRIELPNMVTIQGAHHADPACPQLADNRHRGGAPSPITIAPSRFRSAARMAA